MSGDTRFDSIKLPGPADEVGSALTAISPVTAQSLTGDRSTPLLARPPWRVALVGTGYIAETHAAVLSRSKDVQITAVVDVDRGRATSFQERWKVPAIVEEGQAVAALPELADIAHILVPPQFHMSVAAPLLSTGMHVFIEKPMAQSPAECEAITAAARAGGSRFRVNHNFIYHPAHRQAVAWIREGKLGRLRHVVMMFSMPLHQLTARQFGHWMFDCPRNLLLEQAIHPLSQIDDLIGPAIAQQCLPMPSEKIGGCELMRTFLVALRSKDATAQLLFSVGESYPVWRAQLVCDDGAISIDYVSNRILVDEARRWLPPFGHFHNGFQASQSGLIQDVRNISNYFLSTFKLRPRSDDFYVSMTDSIKSFYESLKKRDDDVETDRGTRLVYLCAALAESTATVPATTTAPRQDSPGTPRACDVAIIGGTGFIGQHLVSALLKEGKRVSVMARNLRRLPPVYSDPGVVLIQGDATKYDDVCGAIEGVDAVVNLAHGGGSNATDTYRNLLGSARAVAEACLVAGTRRHVFVSSIAALYVGNPHTIINDSTEVDPHAKRRAAYSAAKAEAERLLLSMQRERSLRVCILRPGVVVGEGGLPFHSGLGFFNSERHCMGWNEGNNPLPFVLVTDVVAAIVASLYAPAVDGRSYNLVGDVNLTAREYVNELARVLKRPLRFHPQSVYKLLVFDIAKYAVKLAIGRRDPPPSLRDLRSRGLVAKFDCSGAGRDLGWRPVSDRAEFVRTGIEVYGS